MFSQSEGIELSVSTKKNLEYNIIDGSGEILLNDYENENYKEIGKMSFSIINRSLLSKTELFDVFDSNGDEHILYTYIEKYLSTDNSDIEGMLFEPFFVLNNIYIKKYRNNGAGNHVMSELIK